MANLSKCTSELILLFIFNEEIHLRYWIFISDKSRFYIKRIYRKIYVGFFAFFDEYYKILFFLIFCDRDNHINKFYMIVFISFLDFHFRIIPYMPNMFHLYLKILQIWFIWNVLNEKIFFFLIIFACRIITLFESFGNILNDVKYIFAKIILKFIKIY